MSNSYDRQRALEIALQERSMTSVADRPDLIKRAKKIAKFIEGDEPQEKDLDIKESTGVMPSPDIEPTPRFVADALTPDDLDDLSRVDAKVGLRYMQGRMANLEDSLNAAREANIEANKAMSTYRGENSSLQWRNTRLQEQVDKLKADESEVWNRALDTIRAAFDQKVQTPENFVFKDILLGLYRGTEDPQDELEDDDE